MIYTPTIHHWMAVWRFNVNGNVRQNWRVTASADTREGPVKDLFSTSWASRPIRYSGVSTRTIITRRSATMV